VSKNGNSDIPGAPSWVRHLLGRFDDRMDVLAEIVQDARGDLALAVGQFLSVRDTVANHQERIEKAEAEIIQLKTLVRRSLTPPGGMPAANGGIPDDAA
jgi:hypothetical protein